MADEVSFLIAGGGCAGLSLAYHLAQSPLSGASILIVDPVLKDTNDRTWCFWSPPGFPFTGIACQSWPRLKVVDPERTYVFDLDGTRYWMVRGIDYYRAIHDRLKAFPNIRFLQGRVSRVEDGPDRAEVTVGSEVIPARWVFDSVFKPGSLNSDPTKYHHLIQHFKGWEIETAHPAFEPAEATLFDFRTPQNGALSFFYVLPLSERRALVEYTHFSARVLSQNAYSAGLERYLASELGLSDYRVTAEENGVISMTDQPFTRRAGKRILNIGTKGGLVKPSSGYAFKRIQQDSAAIVQSLQTYEDPFHIPHSPARYRLYDSIMLQLMTHRGSEMAAIFSQLFRRNPPARIFRFLDEEARPGEDARLMASLPVKPFLSALIKIKVFRKI